MHAYVRAFVDGEAGEDVGHRNLCVHRQKSQEKGKKRKEAMMTEDGYGWASVGTMVLSKRT